MKRSTEKQLPLVLKEAAKQALACKDFTGIGVVLFDDTFDHRCHTDLRPSAPIPKNISLNNTEEAASALIKFSCKSCNLHDGFYFFDGKTGLLTHAAQYFVPPAVPSLKVNENYGVRYHSAMYGSCIDGVLLTGVVNSNDGYHLFRKGRVLKID